MAYMQLKFRFVLVLVICTNLFYAQTKSIAKLDEDDANEHFNHRNYLMAIPIYRKELKKDPENDVMRFKLAQCLLYTKINRDEAVTLLEKLVKTNKEYHEAWRELGRAYHLTNKLDKAESAYKKYIELKPKKKA